MSARGRGGGRGQQPSAPSAGRGKRPSRGRGSSRGGGNVPPFSSLSVSAPPFQPPPAQPADAATRDMEKLSLQHSATGQASSSTPLAVNPPAQQALPSSAKELRSPLRPGFGTHGRKVIVRANHFLVSYADKDLNHYDVSICPEVRSKKVCRDIMKQLVKSYQASHLGNRMLAYDGRKSCYTAGQLPFTSEDFIVELVDKDSRNGREQKFKVSIKFASKPDLHHLEQFLHRRQLDVPQETLQCLDVVLRDNPSSNYVVVGRSFFHPHLGDKGKLGNGLEYWKGFYQSLRPTQNGLSLNIDMSAQAFFEPIYVSEFVEKFLNINLSMQNLSDQDRIKVTKALRGLKVEISYQGHIRHYKVSDVTPEPVQRMMFTWNDKGTSISVFDYFHQKYNLVLKYPMLPAIQSGNDTKPNYIPMEVCKILDGQRYSDQLNEEQVKAMLRATCQCPKDREESIRKMVKRNNYNTDPLVTTEFGINVDLELTKCKARILPPPMLKYNETGKVSCVVPGTRSWNMKDKKMVNGGRVDFWACVNFSTRVVDADWFCRKLISMCCSKGMEFNPNPLVPILHKGDAGNIEKTLFDIEADCTEKLERQGKKGRQLQLLIVILPDARGWSYGIIKRICETELAIVSQCCRPQLKYNPQYMENVALKINVKVGGRNTVLQQAISGNMQYVSDTPTIIFGADVTHPRTGDNSSPSIAAVVASIDWPEVTKYRALVSAQEHREEIIQDLYTEEGKTPGGMIRELLRSYNRSTGQKPLRIIFYRDGVGEGQFKQVLRNEVAAIIKACSSLEAEYDPKITFVVVQKRHHTRLFAENHGDLSKADSSGNILPGTVVDTEICHPNGFDFYLCSHAGVQGTSRPTHYHVLYDDNKFKADELQRLTNNLCYTYARCTRPVSIVPPAYYAHLAAFRARYYIDNGPGPDGANQEVRALPVIKDNVKDVMFYC